MNTSVGLEPHNNHLYHDFIQQMVNGGALFYVVCCFPRMLSIPSIIFELSFFKQRS